MAAAGVLGRDMDEFYRECFERVVESGIPDRSLHTYWVTHCIGNFDSANPPTVIVRARSMSAAARLACQIREWELCSVTGQSFDRDAIYDFRGVVVQGNGKDATRGMALSISRARARYGEDFDNRAALIHRIVSDAQGYRSLRRQAAEVPLWDLTSICTAAQTDCLDYSVPRD